MDVDAFSDLVGDIYDAAADETIWARIGQSISRSLRAQNYVVLSSDFEGAPGEVETVILATNWTETAIEAYSGHWYETDPWLNNAYKARHMRPFLGSEIFPQERLDSLEIFNEFGVPLLNCYWMLSAMLPPIAGRTLSITLHRARDDAPFDDDEKVHLQTILPHLGRALKLRSALLEKESLLRTAHHAISGMNVGACVLDRQGRVVDLNAYAEAVFRMADGLSLDAMGRISAAGIGQNERLQALLARGRLGTLERSGGGMSVERPSGRPALRLLLTPVPTAMLNPETEEPRYLLLVTDPADPRRAAKARLAEAYGLTGRETDVLVSVAAGQEPSEISRSLGISRETVRTHLKSLFRKLGVRRQADLVKAVASGPF